MNKDLDARILPSGEYRDAENISVSRSEGADVGAVENILGNKFMFDVAAKLGNPIGLECIGAYSDTGTDRIYLFVTNYTDSSDNRLDNKAGSGSTCAILLYQKNSTNPQTGYDATSTILVQGSFLNFSKTQPVYGINLIENLLFKLLNYMKLSRLNVKFIQTTIITRGLPKAFQLLHQNLFLLVRDLIIIQQDQQYNLIV